MINRHLLDALNAYEEKHRAALDAAYTQGHHRGHRPTRTGEDGMVQVENATEDGSASAGGANVHGA